MESSGKEGPASVWTGIQLGQARTGRVGTAAAGAQHNLAALTTRVLLRSSQRARRSRVLSNVLSTLGVASRELYNWEDAADWGGLRWARVDI